MRGHLQHRGGDAWRIKVYLGRSADGRRRYLERTARGTRRDAEREMARLVVEVDDGRHAAAAPMTFGELLDRWLEVKRASVAPRTIESYEWIAAKYLRPRLGDRKLASLRTIDLDAVYAELHASGLSVRTVRICHTVVRQSLEQARRWGLIARSPAVDATPPRSIRTEVTPPTVDEVVQLLDAAYEDDPAFGTFLWVKAATGCRRGEMCALRWSDVDLDRPELSIRRAITQVGRELVEKDTKTHQSAVSPSTRRRWGCSASTGCDSGRGPCRWVCAWPTMRCCSALWRVGRGDRMCARTGSAGCGRASGSTGCGCTTSVTSWRRCSSTAASRSRR